MAEPVSLTTCIAPEEEVENKARWHSSIGLRGAGLHIRGRPKSLVHVLLNKLLKKTVRRDKGTARLLFLLLDQIDGSVVRNGFVLLDPFGQAGLL